eukprot:EG_transcript_27368
MPKPKDRGSRPVAKAGPPAGFQWPQDVLFTPYNIWDPRITREEKKAFALDEALDQARPPPYGKATRSALVRPQPIADPGHPAHGQCGLFAQAELQPHTLVLQYCGVVQKEENESKTSHYVLAFANGLSIDSEQVGNEARFINDFRNTGRQPNVRFDVVRSPRGRPVGMGVFVLSRPVPKGAELLVTYGKGYWQDSPHDGGEANGE